MNPELPQVQPNPEAIRQIPGSIEYSPEQPGQAPDVLRGLESAPAQAVEQQATVVPAALPVTMPNPVVVDGNGSDGSAISNTPAAAADDDLIEREWVDKIKNIIALTKNDPYERNRVIAQLQADYLKKRYNKTLGRDIE